MNPATSSVSPFQTVNSFESRRNSSQLLGKSSRPAGVPLCSNISRLYQSPQEPAVTGRPYVFPANRQLSSTAGGQFPADAYCACCIRASSGSREPRAARAAGEVQRTTASGGFPAAMRASNTSLNSWSPVPHCVSAIAILGWCCSKSLAIASSPAQNSPPPPGVQKVTVVFCPLPAGVEEVPHAARQAVPPPQLSQRRNARRSSACQHTPWFLRLMTCRPSDVPQSYNRGLRSALCMDPASLTQQT